MAIEEAVCVTLISKWRSVKRFINVSELAAVRHLKFIIYDAVLTGEEQENKW